MVEKIKLAQGAGGEVMDKLIKEKILKYFAKDESSEVSLSMLDDSAVVEDIVFSTDSHTVQPLIFPGGDIGSLAVSGTVNDISVMGAEPIALSAGFIIEEGFSIEIFEKIVIWSMPQEVIDNEVKIVWEETKDVLNSGKIVKRIIINKNEKKQFLTNFPHSTENKIIHIRPHAKNAEDTLVLPIPDKLTGKLEYTKQCFWLDRRYILKIIKGDV